MGSGFKSRCDQTYIIRRSLMAEQWFLVPQMGVRALPLGRAPVIGMAEWLKVSVLKTDVSRDTVGSNPTPCKQKTWKSILFN